MKDILETLTEDGSFQNLISTLNLADLVKKLQEPGPFTFFAPNDEAFDRINLDEITKDKSNLASILTYHLLTGKLSSSEIGQSESLSTENGKSLTVRIEQGLTLIDNGKFVTTDIECSNGVIHVIDNVFLPRFSGWYCACC